MAQKQAPGRIMVHITAGEKAVAWVMVTVENADLWDIDCDTCNPA